VAVYGRTTPLFGLHYDAPFALLLPVTFVSAWFGGARAGLLATVGGALLGFYASAVSLTASESGIISRLLLFLANGTPMICAGDEFMNTQRGNNNPYNQDNETTWLDWDLLRRNAEIFRFFKMMIAFRKAHPSIGRSRFWREDVQWYGVKGPADWSASAVHLAYCLRGASQNDQDMYVMINGGTKTLEFAIQDGAGPWRRIVDTALASPHDIEDETCAPAVAGETYAVRPRSVVVLLSAAPGPGRSASRR
jgi:pullulanase/glycogen debranching enzyme